MFSSTGAGARVGAGVGIGAGAGGGAGAGAGASGRARSTTPPARNLFGSGGGGGLEASVPDLATKPAATFGLENADVVEVVVAGRKSLLHALGVETMQAVYGVLMGWSFSSSFVISANQRLSVSFLTEFGTGDPGGEGDEDGEDSEDTEDDDDDGDKGGTSAAGSKDDGRQHRGVSSSGKGGGAKARHKKSFLGKLARFIEEALLPDAAIILAFMTSRHMRKGEAFWRPMVATATRRKRYLALVCAGGPEERVTDGGFVQWIKWVNRLGVNNALRAAGSPVRLVVRNGADVHDDDHVMALCSDEAEHARYLKEYMSDESANTGFRNALRADKAPMTRAEARAMQLGRGGAAACGERSVLLVRTSMGNLSPIQKQIEDSEALLLKRRNPLDPAAPPLGFHTLPPVFILEQVSSSTASRDDMIAAFRRLRAKHGYSPGVSVPVHVLTRSRLGRFSDVVAAAIAAGLEPIVRLGVRPDNAALIKAAMGTPPDWARGIKVTLGQHRSLGSVELDMEYGKALYAACETAEQAGSAGAFCLSLQHATRTILAKEDQYFSTLAMARQLLGNQAPWVRIYNEMPLDVARRAEGIREAIERAGRYHQLQEDERMLAEQVAELRLDIEAWTMGLREEVALVLEGRQQLAAAEADLARIQRQRQRLVEQAARESGGFAVAAADAAGPPFPAAARSLLAQWPSNPGSADERLQSEKMRNNEVVPWAFAVGTAWAAQGVGAAVVAASGGGGG